MNLLEETVAYLSEFSKTPKDVFWVGNLENGCMCDWETFEKLADLEYDEGFGIEQINLNLVVVGDNWWLERHEYDGSEWWEYKKLPKTLSINKFSSNDIKTKYYRLP